MSDKPQTAETARTQFLFEHLRDVLELWECDTECGLGNWHRTRQDLEHARIMRDARNIEAEERLRQA